MSVIDFLGVTGVGIFVVSLLALICAAIAGVATGMRKKYKTAKKAYDDFIKNKSLTNYNEYMKHMAAYKGDAEPTPSKTIPSGFVATAPSESVLISYSKTGTIVGAGMSGLALIFSSNSVYTAMYAGDLLNFIVQGASGIGQVFMIIVELIGSALSA
jgi:hypothetical protein